MSLNEIKFTLYKFYISFYYNAEYLLSRKIYKLIKKALHSNRLLDALIYSDLELYKSVSKLSKLNKIFIKNAKKYHLARKHLISILDPEYVRSCSRDPFGTDIEECVINAWHIQEYDSGLLYYPITKEMYEVARTVYYKKKKDSVYYDILFMLIFRCKVSHAININETGDSSGCILKSKEVFNNLSKKYSIIRKQIDK